MTAASLDPGPSLFSVFSTETSQSTRRETFALSFLAQGAILAVIIYLTSFVIVDGPTIMNPRHPFEESRLIFSGRNGGGGGNFDPMPASRGTPPRASLEAQIVPPTVIVPKEMPRLPVEETVVVAPDVKFLQTGRVGDPSSQFSQWSSDGPGGPRGSGTGCCNGIGPSTGPGVGAGTLRNLSSRKVRRVSAASDLQPGAELLRRGQKVENAGSRNLDGGRGKRRPYLQFARGTEPGNGAG